MPQQFQRLRTIGVGILRFGELGDGFLKHALLLITEAEQQQSVEEVWLEGQRSLAVADRFIIIACKIKDIGKAGIRIRREGVELLRAFYFLQRFAQAPHSRQKIGVPGICHRTVRIGSYGSLK